MKWCNKAKHWVSTDLFYKRKSSRDGLHPWCKNCDNESNAIRRIEKAEFLKEQKKLYNYKHKEKIKQYCQQRRFDKWEELALKRYKKAAAKQGDISDLELSDMKHPDYCSADCGTKLDRRGNRDIRPSLDRIDSNKTYIKINCRWLCGKCNRLKQEATAEDLERLARYIRKNLIKS